MRNLNRPTALAAAAIALIIGAVGPWISVLGLFSGGPTNSTEVAIVVFGGITFVILSALTGRFMRPVSILVAVGILAEAINVFVKIQQANDDSELGSLVTPGWGLYLSIVACLFLIGSTWIAKKETL